MLSLIVTLQSLLAQRFERDDKGASMVEYGLLVALIAVIVAVGAAALGGAINGLFTTTATTVN